MPRITGVWWQPFRIPLRRRLLTAHGAVEAREGLLLGIRTADREGLGEISPLPSYAGGDVRECAARLPAIADALLGNEPADCWTSSVRSTTPATPGSQAALDCGVETALADLLAQDAGQPLWRWLARGAGLAEPVGNPPVPVNALIDATEPQAAANEAAAAIASGFRTLKVKVGRDAQADHERVAAVREAAGPGVSLRVDANGAWTVAEALARLAGYARLGVTLVEQPTSASRPDAIDALVRVRQGTTLQVAADESCSSPAVARRLIDEGAVGAMVVKPMMVGLRNAIEVVAIGSRAAIPTIVTTSFEAGVGTAAAIHVAATLPVPRLACGLSTLAALAFDIAEGVPAIERGAISTPRDPGLGVRLNCHRLERAATGPRQAAGSA